MIRAGTVDDLARVGEIQAASAEASQWVVEEYLTYSFVVAEREGSVVGFAVWRAVFAGEWELLNLAVDPAWRGRGIGRELVEALPAGRVFLEVRASNLAARGLYESSGFAVLGVRRGYYQAPSEDGIVMELQK